MDKAIVSRGLVSSRSQAESYIRLGKILVNDHIVQKTGFIVDDKDEIKFLGESQYVSRAGHKLESVAKLLKLDFRKKIVLDVGSSTGGFTDFAIKHGADKVLAVDVGTNQLHPSLRTNEKIELHEKTDIRDFKTDTLPDIILIDVSFISLRKILPYLCENLMKPNTEIVAMMKPQFEVGRDGLAKGVVKNSKIRRDTIKDFELWLKQYFVILDKHDSGVAGENGNVERFYLLKKIEHK